MTCRLLMMRIFCNIKSKVLHIYLLRQELFTLSPKKTSAQKALGPKLGTSAGHLFWIYRQLIGMSYIALARQVQTYRNISDPLGRLGF